MSHVYDVDDDDDGDLYADNIQHATHDHIANELNSASTPSTPSEPRSPPPRRPRTGNGKHPRPASKRTQGSEPAPPPDPSTGAGRAVFSRMLAREDRKLHSLLLVTTERLDAETKRANAAEARAVDFLARIRAAGEARDSARADLARVSEELRLYKIQLDAAQQEIFRAQEVIDQVDALRVEAEEDAARARSKARRLQEEKLVMVAREEGHRMGYREGLARGRRMGYEAARAAGYGPDDVVNDYSDEEAEAEAEQEPPAPVISYRESSPTPPPRQAPRQSPPDIRSQSARPPSTRGNRVFDTALHAPTLPVPTLVTPISAPSPSHAPLHTPIPVPLAAPAHSPEDIRPIPVHNRQRVPLSQHADIPPDNWIPVSRPGSPYFDVPPPHEMQQPLASPSSPAPPLPGDRGGSVYAVHPQSVSRRDYAYGGAAGAPQRARSPSGASQGSTRISQLDLVSPPRAGREGAQTPRTARSVFSAGGGGGGDGRDSRWERSARGGPRERSQPERIADEWRHANRDLIYSPPRGPVRNDQWRAPSPRLAGGPRRPRDLVMPDPLAGASSGAPPPLARPPTSPPQSPTRSATTSEAARPRSALDFLRRRFRRTESSNVVPEISVEPPSQSPSDKSEGGGAREPHLLSPEHAPAALPPEPPQPSPPPLPPLPPYPAAPPDAYHVPPLKSPGGASHDAPLPGGFVALGGPPALTHAEYYSRFRPATPLYAGLPAGKGDPYARPATAAGGGGGSPAQGGGGRGEHRRNVSLGSGSPAPLQRPFSIFSEETQ